MCVCLCLCVSVCVCVFLCVCVLGVCLWGAGFRVSSHTAPKRFRYFSNGNPLSDLGTKSSPVTWELQVAPKFDALNPEA